MQVRQQAYLVKILDHAFQMAYKTELPLWLSREDMPGAQLNYIISWHSLSPLNISYTHVYLLVHG